MADQKDQPRGNQLNIEISEEVADGIYSNLAIITQREDYTNKSIDILNNGADDLTLANLNEEGANLLSLQTSQSLAVQSLSIASSSAANVLNIIR